MDPDPSHLCCSSAKTSSHYHIHPSILLPCRKDQGRKFSLAKEKELNFHPYLQEGREEDWFCANYLLTLPIHGKKNCLFLPSVFTARNLDTNVIERKVIFTSPFSSSFLHEEEEEKEERESRIENRLRARDHSLTHYMDLLLHFQVQVQVYKRNEGRKKKQNCCCCCCYNSFPPFPKEETALLREGLV